MSIAKTYLLAYNASLIAGWSYVLLLAGAAFAEGGAGAVYAAVEIPLLAAQTAACLLYTSPSPRDQRGSRMPSSA